MQQWCTMVLGGNFICLLNYCIDQLNLLLELNIRGMRLARVVNVSWSRSDHKQALFLDYPTLFKILEQS